MATRKAGTRFTDRNIIKRMHAQGYDLEQICTKVSVLPKYVQAVIDGNFERKKGDTTPSREMSLADARRRVAEAEEFEKAQEQAEQATADEEAEILAEAQRVRDEEAAELEAAADAAEVPPVAEPEPEPEPETTKATRRPRRKNQEASDDG